MNCFKKAFYDIIQSGSDVMNKITKNYNFTRTKDINSLPQYVKDYIFDDEQIYVVYTTLRDHGVFTDKKIILFDNRMTFSQNRVILAISYESISAIAVVYKPNSAILRLHLDNGNIVNLKFIRMIPTDKMRLRYLYTIILRLINNQKITQSDINKLINNDFKIE